MRILPLAATALATILAQPAYAQLATVFFGSATIVDTNGQAPANRSTQVAPGQTIVAGNAPVNLVMSDGTRLALEPNTVVQFNVQPNGSYQLTLQQGNLRATQPAGSTTQMNIVTATGTVSVQRGAFTVGTTPDGGMIAIPSQGSIVVRGSNGASTIVSPGQSASIGPNGGAPQVRNGGPGGTTGVASNQGPTNTQSDPKTSPGDQAAGAPKPPPADGPDGPLPATPPQTSSGPTGPSGPTSPGGGAPETSGSVSAGLGSGPYTIAYASRAVGLDTRRNSTATFDGNNALQGYRASASEDLDRGTNVVADLAGDATVQVGRWNGGTTTGTYYSSPAFSFGGHNGYHYAIGVATPNAITSGSATYNLVAATAPTFGDGGSAPGTLTGSLGVNFGLVSRVGVDLNVAMPGDRTYVIGTAGGAADPSQSNIQISAANWATQGSNFYGTVNIASGGRACTSMGLCTVYLQGFLAGGNAEGAGLVYVIGGNTVADTSIHGAAYFGGTGVQGGTVTAPVSSGSISAPLGAGPYAIAGYGTHVVAATSATLDGNGRLTHFQNTYTDAQGIGIGTNAVADLWGNENLTIGRWNGGTTVATTPTTYFPDMQSMAYLVARPATNLPGNGLVATYSLAAATKATAADGGVTPGTLSGSLAVAFTSTPRVGFELDVTVPGDRVYAFASTGGLTNPGTSQYIVQTSGVNFPVGTFGASGSLQITSGGHACPNSGATCFVTVSGILAGDAAANAGLSYQVWQSGVTGQAISGTAAFSQDPPRVPNVSPGAVANPQADGNYGAIIMRQSGNSEVLTSNAFDIGAAGHVESVAVRVSSPATTVHIGTNDVADLGQNADVTWSRWTDGFTAGTGNYNGYVGADLTGNRGMHFLVGTPTAAFPANATATYTLAGATAPTFADGRTAPGTLSGSIAVNWNGFGSRIGTDLTVTMPGDAAYRIQTTGGVADPTQSQITAINTNRFNGSVPVTFTTIGAGTGGACPTPGNCTATVNGQAFGANGATMGLGYVIGFSNHAVTGVGAFSRQ